MGALGCVLKAAVVAGLIAGAMTAGFHTLLLEPLIERAIGLEEQTSHALGHAVQEPLIDRPTQRWGLVLGFVLYGGVWGVLFGLVAYGVQAVRPATTARFGFTLALLVGWSVAILPFLKYPANPPGVGEAATIAYRQGLYLGFLGLSVVGTVAAVGVHYWHQHSPRFAPTGRTPVHLAIAAAYVIYVTVVYLVMPANPDPVELPAALVWWFRGVALLGLILFWVVLGGAFVWLLREAPTPSPVRGALE
jgi:Probable cobalt transporter subunit (CbtA)